MRGDQECSVWNKESVPDAGAGNPPGISEKNQKLGFSGVRKTWCQKDNSNLEKSQFYVEKSGLTTPTWWRNENYQYLVKVTALQFWGLASQPRECWNAPATRRDRSRLSKGWLTQGRFNLFKVVRLMPFGVWELLVTRTQAFIQSEFKCIIEIQVNFPSGVWDYPVQFKHLPSTMETCSSQWILFIPRKEQE